MLMDHAHDGVKPVLAQDHGVEHEQCNVIVTTQITVVLTLQAPTLIMYVEPTFDVHILSLCRFDEFPCHLTQALCRGATTNHLVRMVERGRLQDTKFSHPTPSDAATQEWIENATRLDGVVPPPSVYICPSAGSSTLLPTHRKLQDTTTGAWLSPLDAIAVIYLILQERSKSGFGVPGQLTVRFSKRDETPPEVCEVNIPGLTDYNKIKKYGHSKLEALVSGCLQACQLLQMCGLLEPTHFPTVYPFVPSPRTIEPQQSKKAKSNGVRIHPRRTPLFWSLSTGTLGGQWYPTVLFVGSSMGEFGLLAILTRHPLPVISDFPLFVSGNSANVRLRKCHPRSFSLRDLDILRRTTLRIIRFVGNKPFVCDLNRLPYLLFPLEPDVALLNSFQEPYWAHEGSPFLGSPCASGVVMSIAASAFLPITTDSTEEIIKDLNDAVIQDRKIEYTKHYFVNKIREDLTPLHKPQEGEVRVQQLGLSSSLITPQRQHGSESYLEHCKARIKDFQGIKNLNQPLVEVEVAPGIIDQLGPSKKSQPAEKSAPQSKQSSPQRSMEFQLRAAFIPELCVKSTVPARCEWRPLVLSKPHIYISGLFSSIARTALAFPSIVTKIDEALLVKELNARMFDNTIREDLLREALTPPVAEAESNYERLEILGNDRYTFLPSK
jgi:endoribonuclease Dicer